MITTLIATSLFLGSSIGVAEEQRFTADISLPENQSSQEWNNIAIEEKAGGIIGVQRIYVGNLVFVEAQNESFLISEDGRFLFRGGIFQDRWQGQNVNDLEAAFRAMRIPLSHYPVDLDEDVASFQIGSASTYQGAIFVDPTTQFSRDIVAEVLESPEKYNIHVVLMPAVGGDDAMARSMSLYCASNKAQAIEDLAYNTSESFSAMKPGCKREKVPMSLMLNSAFRIEGIPHLIRADGRVSAGKPVDLHSWFTKDTRQTP
ncbi:hypothetical protein [Aliidiomarina quisquiliarum]|uniref:hypothetical protein n=1 Tax=Aliidiomarina quisquiliarum TaxID=2938947 RepID=UPI00208F410B|nr:hypothetical protein [Aliidiomarina quisquiliarum]MCO4319896.1 hypothetical protein [Aliidiomarina quisquiliarum]